MTRQLRLALSVLVAFLVAVTLSSCTVPGLPPQADAFHLAGAHESLGCVQCHTEGLGIAIPVTCAGCHEPQRPANHYQGDCGDCHSPTRWQDAIVDHTQFLPLSGGHTGLACTDCHAADTFTGLNPSCESCHEAARPVGHFPGSCADCHTVDGWGDMSFHEDYLPLGGGHEGQSCTMCHAPDSYLGLDRACESCHLPQTPRNHFEGPCAACHVVAGWELAQVDHTDFLPLGGGHTGVACTECHGTGGFTGLDRACESCHQPDAPVGHFQGPCVECHVVASWTQASFDHSRYLSLLGGHAGLDCVACHDASGYSGLDAACESCHLPDRPAGHFQGPCVQCHVVASWSQASFDHSRYLSLLGGHAGLDCGACHNASGYTGLSRACASCHLPDAPVGHFTGACDTCHNVVRSSDATFAHNSYFPTPHRGISACNQCHLNNDGYATFSCTNCHTHNRTTEDRHHRGEVSNYVYASQSCFNCHRRGQGGD